MRLALDFDDTWTKHPKFWSEFVKLANKHGITVDIVTMRHRDIDRLTRHHERKLKAAGINEIFYVGAKDGSDDPLAKPKKDSVADLGITYDVWIDDNPIGIVHGTTYNKRKLNKWRANDKYARRPA